MYKHPNDVICNDTLCPCLDNYKADMVHWTKPFSVREYLKLKFQYYVRDTTYGGFTRVCKPGQSQDEFIEVVW